MTFQMRTPLMAFLLGTNFAREKKTKVYVLLLFQHFAIYCESVTHTHEFSFDHTRLHRCIPIHPMNFFLLIKNQILNDNHLAWALAFGRVNEHVMATTCLL